MQVNTTEAQEIAKDVIVIPNRGVDLVPNIGIIGGTHSALVIETDLGPGYLTMFRTLGEAVARELEDTELATPDVTYAQTHTLDLGNRKVELRATGQAHTKDHQIIKLPEEAILFTGDQVEANQFAIFPWFPHAT